MYVLLSIKLKKAAIRKDILALFGVFFVFSYHSFAQIIPENSDSTKIYETIQTYSKRSKFANFVYRLIFKAVPGKPKKKGSKNKIKAKTAERPLKNFEGKIIRHIFIDTYDPFGYSITDTTFSQKNLLTQTANRLHIKTKDITIQNLLLFRPNQFFDSLLIKESERLVRARGYIRDVSIIPQIIAANSDSVDIYVREIDKWSILPNFSVSANGLGINIQDKNFLGLGHESQNNFSWHRNTNTQIFLTNYIVQNFRNSFINGRISLGTDNQGNTIKMVGADRPFFSAFSKWAAGINFSQEFHLDSIWIKPSEYEKQIVKFNTQDYWVGTATPITRGQSEIRRVSKIVLALRMNRKRIQANSTQISDSLHNYFDESFYFVSTGVSRRRYLQDKYIYKFGVREDIPYGYVLCLTYGYQVKNAVHRKYVGSKISYGNYFTWGYVSSSFDYGLFLRSLQPEQGTFSVNVEFFTNLQEIRKWKIRQFIKSQLIFGINRFPYDSLTLNSGYGINGFSSTMLKGTSRATLTIQMQTYAPWDLLGFHFGPFFVGSIGALGKETSGFSKSKIFSQIGIGVLIKNEKLIINTFQFSISFFPNIPGSGLNIIKFNSFQTTDFGFRDFEIGKPEEILYQ